MFLSPEKSDLDSEQSRFRYYDGFDECPQFLPTIRLCENSIERTSRWAERGLKKPPSPT